MIDITLKNNLKEISKRLADYPKQVKYATARALTATAFDAKRAIERQIPQKLNVPIRFTRGAIAVRKATKTNLSAQVFVRGVSGAPKMGASRQYLQKQIEGGRRKARRGRFPTPVGGRLKNKYGNIPRKKIATMLARSVKGGHASVFSGKPRGWSGAPDGVWMRVGRGKQKGRTRLELLATWRKVSDDYKPGRLPMSKIVRGVVKGRLQKHIDHFVDEAIRTRRK